MATTSDATPLLALDAMAIDTETTALDARKARIVEIALVPIAGGKVDTSAAYRRIVRPDVAIPAHATRIHGIDAEAVRDAPPFARLWAEIEATVGGAVLIGHAVGFDLAVLKNECTRAGIAWRRPRALDTRLLAQVAAPELAGYALEEVAAWLDVEVAGRHSAKGDAATAGRVFLGLLPRLREGGIRTLAEAERACAALTDAVDKQHRAGWEEPTVGARSVDAGAVAQRIDSYPYRHRAGDLMSSPASFARRDVPMSAALNRMVEEKVSSLLVRFDEGDGPALPGDTGIVTERDVMRALASGGAVALGVPVGDIASRPLATVPAEAFAFLVIARMNRLHVRHLGVTDESGRIVGALSARDLLRLRAEASAELGDEIEQASDVQGLGRAWARLPVVAARLLAEGLSGIEIAALVSHQVRALTQRACVLAERRMREAGRADAPCPYAFAVLGSAARGESLLAMDQDNALVFADGAEGGDHDRWFAELAAHVADMLHQVGVPYCRGGVMAKNPQWRGSLASWRQRVRGWIGKSRPQDLLSIDIFFDMRGVHGDTSLCDLLWREGFAAAKGQAAFAKLLIETAGASQPALNFFGGFRTDKGRLDLKKSGLFGIVSAARAMAICHHVVERSTPARLAGMSALGAGVDDLDALVEAQRAFLDLVLAQQIVDVGQGISPASTVELKRLSPRDRQRLRSALEAVSHLEELSRDLLFGPQVASR